MTGHKDHEMAVAEAGAEAPASFLIQPQPQNGSFMEKLGIFGLGFVAGVASLTITAAIVEKAASNSAENVYNTTLEDCIKDRSIDVIHGTSE